MIVKRAPGRSASKRQFAVPPLTTARFCSEPLLFKQWWPNVWTKTSPSPTVLIRKAEIHTFDQRSYIFDSLTYTIQITKTLELRLDNIRIGMMFSRRRSYGRCYLPLWNISLKHWGRNKMAAISQTTFSNALSWMKMYIFHFRFHWSLFLRTQLTIFQHWFR